MAQDSLQAMLLEGLLDGLELELQARSLWSHLRPSPEALQSELPFAVDVLALEEWLQFIFLPTLRAQLEAGEPLPNRSGVSDYAREVWPSSGEYQQLLAILAKLDQLLNALS